jgi:hypothetical protein
MPVKPITRPHGADCLDKRTDCFKPNDPTHGAICHCGRPAKWHIMYGSGCGHVCGVHKRSIERIKGRCTVRPL